MTENAQHPDNSRIILGYFYIQDYQLRFSEEKSENLIGTLVQEGEEQRAYLIAPWEEVTGHRALEMFPNLEPILKFVLDGSMWTDGTLIYGKPV